MQGLTESELNWEIATAEKGQNAKPHNTMIQVAFLKIAVYRRPTYRKWVAEPISARKSALQLHLAILTAKWWKLSTIIKQKKSMYHNPIKIVIEKKS